MGSDVAHLFDRMAASYDRLEPWYEHLYARLETIARTSLAPPRPGARALDAGCGTGFQTAWLRDLGFVTHGADLSAGLLDVARRKLPAVPFARADLEALPYRDGAFDAVTCCGSTLSFVDAPARAIAELGRVLRPRGLVLLECEQKWSLDLAWALASAVAGDPLGYGLTPAEAWRQLARPIGEGFHADYPVALPDGAQGYMRLRLFTMAEIAAMLRAAGLVTRRAWGIHAVTNVVPSTVLHRPALPRPLAAVYRALCALDTALAPVTSRCANSVVVLAEKVG
ncbi:MAG: methyltransferase domain-containing protein [Candidatus Rokubacteria bacterium]|nr:methyltransferase domain-containing protein [Candidatus Rokubacteria bacterium]